MLHYAKFVVERSEVLKWNAHDLAKFGVRYFQSVERNVKPGVIRKHKGMCVNCAKCGVKIFIFVETYEINFISVIISMLRVYETLPLFG